MADCDWVILCDYAFIAVPNKLSMIGVFDTIFSHEVPVTHQHAAVGFSIIGEPGETGQMKLEIIDPNGQPITQGGGNFTLPDSGSGYASLEFWNLVLPEFGRYAIQIDLGEHVPKVAWFTLKQVP